MEGFGNNKSPRIERALNLLADEAFDRVVEVINAELDENPSNSYAYWLLLLAEHQCASENVLVQRGIPFTKEKTYGYVLRYASEAERKHCEDIAQSTLFMTHTKALLCATQGDVFRMKKWIGHYAGHCQEEDQLNQLHKMMEKAGGLTEVNDYTLGVLAILYHIYGALGQSVGGAVQEQIGKLYAQCVEKMMERISQTATVGTKKLSYKEDPQKTDKELREKAVKALEDPDIRRFVDPEGVWQENKGTPGLPETMPDGTAVRTEVRIALLIGKLLENPVWEVGRYAVIDGLYDRIGDEQGRNAFHKSILERKELTDIELQYLALRSNDPKEAAWQYVKRATGDFSVSLPNMGEGKDVEKFLKNSLWDNAKRKEIQKTLEQSKDRAKGQEEKILQPLSVWAQVATAAPDSPYKAPWEEFTKKVHTAVEERVKAYEDLQEKVKTAIEDYDQNLAKRSATTGRIAAVVSLVALVIGLVPLLWAAALLLKPDLVLNYPMYPLYGISLGATLVLILIARGIQKSQKEAKRIKNDSPMAKYTPGCRRFTNAAPALTGFAGLLAAAGLALSFFTAGSQIGDQTISTPEDFNKIAQFPSGQYVLTADVDMAGQALPEVVVFSGTFNGNGFAIKNANQKSAWIQNNMGKVQNLTLQDSTVAKALVENNQGLIRKVSATNVTMALPEELPDELYLAMLVETNKDAGIVAECQISGGGVKMEGKLPVPDGLYLGSMVAKNAGQIISCHSNAAITLKGDWSEGDKNPRYFIGGLVGSGYEGAIIGASYTGTISGNLEDNIETTDLILYVGGLAGIDANIQKSFFNGKLTLKLTTPKGKGTTTCFVGALAGSGTASDSYAKGKLTVENTVKTKKTVTLRLGALLGRGLGDTAVTNCYHSLTCSISNKLKGEKEVSYNYCKLVGEAANVENSFVYGTKKVKKIWGKHSLNYAACYVAKALSVDQKDLKGEGELKTVKDPRKAGWIGEKLGWSPDIWALEEGKLPELQPVVYEDAPATETTGETTVETTTSEEAA